MCRENELDGLQPLLRETKHAIPRLHSRSTFEYFLWRKWWDNSSECLSWQDGGTHLRTWRVPPPHMEKWSPDSCVALFCAQMGRNSEFILLLCVSCFILAVQFPGCVSLIVIVCDFHLCYFTFLGLYKPRPLFILCQSFSVTLLIGTFCLELLPWSLPDLFAWFSPFLVLVQPACNWPGFLKCLQCWDFLRCLSNFRIKAIYHRSQIASRWCWSWTASWHNIGTLNFNDELPLLC